MTSREDELRQMLLAPPYIDIKSWKDGLRFAGPGYLENLSEDMLLSVKAQLDQVFATGSEDVLKSHYDDDM
ncbi:hypothetical protein [Deinococcus sp. UYEF24]